jgi:long-subunit acyl-CoA synthetase (AMP-forming)
VRQVLRAGLVSSDASLMLFLPLAHSFAKLMGYLGFLTTISLKFPAVPDPKSSRMDVTSVTRDIREGGAEIVPIVPALPEKMQEES